MLVVLLSLITFDGFCLGFSDSDDEIPQLVREKIKTLFQRSPNDERCVLPFQDRLIDGKLYSSVPNNPYPYKRYQVAWPICHNIVYGHTLPTANEISGSNPDIKIGLVDILMGEVLKADYNLMIWEHLETAKNSQITIHIDDCQVFDGQLASGYNHFDIVVPAACTKTNVHKIEIRTSQFQNQLFYVLRLESAQDKYLSFEKRTVQWDFPTPLTRRNTGSIKAYLISTAILSILLVLAFAMLPIIGVFYFAKNYDGPHSCSDEIPSVSGDK